MSPTKSEGCRSPSYRSRWWISVGETSALSRARICSRLSRVVAPAVAAVGAPGGGLGVLADLIMTGRSAGPVHVTPAQTACMCRVALVSTSIGETGDPSTSIAHSAGDRLGRGMNDSHIASASLVAVLLRATSVTSTSLFPRVTLTSTTAGAPALLCSASSNARVNKNYTRHRQPGEMTPASASMWRTPQWTSPVWKMPRTVGHTRGCTAG